MENDFKEFYCPICKEWALKEQFLTHRDSKVHFDDVLYPKTLEDLITRFEMIGFYFER